VIDGQQAFVGSANLTGAGLGAKGKHKRNFEAGFLTSDPEHLQELMEWIDQLYLGEFCHKCQRRKVCAGSDCVNCSSAAPNPHGGGCAFQDQPPPATAFIGRNLREIAALRGGPLGNRRMYLICPLLTDRWGAGEYHQAASRKPNNHEIHQEPDSLHL
jgi:hypothetical protein